MIFIRLILVLLVSTKAMALSISPIPASGEILLDKSQSYVYLTNDSSSNQELSLSLSGSGFSIVSNRCPSILIPNQSCYLLISVDTLSLPIGNSSASLQNSSNEIVSLKYNKLNPYSGSSLFTVSSLSLSNFEVQTISMLNNSSSSKSYSPSFSGTDASKFSIILNRCQNVEPNKTCLLSIQLKPQVVGSYSATLSDAQASNSVSISASIGSGVAKPALNQSISISPASIDFGTISKYGLSGTRNLTITNNGNVSVNPLVELSSNLKLILNRCSVSLAPNKSCSVSLALSTSSSIPDGNLNESLSVKATVSSSPVTSSIIANLSMNPSPPLEPVTDFESKIAVSDTHSCAIRGGKIYCWGYGFSGQVTLSAVGSTLGVGFPTLVNHGVLSGKVFTKVSATNQGSCALDDQGSVYCWGRNAYVVGSSSFSGMGIPVKVEGALSSIKVTDIKAGTYKTCALTETFRVYCWGETAYASWDFGTGSSVAAYNTPTLIYTSELTPANPNIVAMSLNGGQTCVLDDTGKAACWGDNYYGQLGNLSWAADHRTYAMEVDNISPRTFKQIAVGRNHSCGITNLDQTYCWGDNQYGQMGNGYNTASPGAVASLVQNGPYSAIWAGNGNNCAIKTIDGLLWCWGRHDFTPGFGALGGYPLSVSFMRGPALVGPDGAEGISDVKIVVLGEHHTCLMRENQDVYCIGTSNLYGEIGFGVDVGYPFDQFRKLVFP